MDFAQFYQEGGGWMHPIAVCAVLYLLLEMWFQVDLYKGPILDRLIDVLRS